MKYFRVVKVERVNNPSGSLGIRRKPICSRNTREEANFVISEFIQKIGGKYEVQEREAPQHLLAPHLRRLSDG